MVNIDIKAWWDNVLVIEEKHEPTKRKSGLLIGDDERVRLSRGIILSIWQGTLLPSGKLIPIALNVWDKILFHSDIANKIIEGGEDYQIIPRKAVIGLYDNNNK